MMETSKHLQIVIIKLNLRIALQIKNVLTKAALIIILNLMAQIVVHLEQLKVQEEIMVIMVITQILLLIQMNKMNR